MGRVIDLTFLGEVPAHKNEKMPVRRRSGKLGLITKPKASLAMDRLALQIPSCIRDSKMEHPDLDIYFLVGRNTVDRDNCACALIDLCVRYGVISSDNVQHFNGTITLHPAVLGKEWKTVLKFKPRP